MTSRRRSPRYLAIQTDGTQCAGSDVAGLTNCCFKMAAANWDCKRPLLNGSKIFITNGVTVPTHAFVARPSGTSVTRSPCSSWKKGTPGFWSSRALDKTGWLTSDV